MVDSGQFSSLHTLLIQKRSIIVRSPLFLLVLSMGCYILYFTCENITFEIFI